MAAAVVNKRSSFQPSCTICQSDGQSEVLSRITLLVGIDGGLLCGLNHSPNTDGWVNRRQLELPIANYGEGGVSRIITLSVDNGGLWPSRKTLAKRHVLGGKVSRVSKHLARKEFNERLDATTLNDQVEASKLLLPNWD
ncbi:hypothetical protein KXV95_004743 [Aspergillus fumigatus]|nr:hypothetical protein KXV95_004743 [Aspergillus fumigatus]